jgi:hypothetical protein
MNWKMKKYPHLAREDLAKRAKESNWEFDAPVDYSAIRGQPRNRLISIRELV